MKKKFKISNTVKALVMLIVLEKQLLAQTNYNDGGSHNIISTVSGPIYLDNGDSGPTTLNDLLGGSIQSGNQGTGISASDSIVNIDGGSVSVGNGSAGDAYAITVNDSSVINIYGGSVSVGNGSGGDANNISVWFMSVLNVYGGTISGGNGAAGDVNMIGALYMSTVNIYGGIISAGYGSAGDVNMIGTYMSTVNIYGGQISAGITNGIGVNLLGISDNSVLNISGGTLSVGPGGSALTVDADSSANIFGTGFNYGYGPIANKTGSITGTLSDGSPINLGFSQQVPGTIVLWPVVGPQPVLNIAVVDGDAIVSWPTNSLNFTLYQNLSLSSTNWLVVTNSPLITNDVNQVVLPVSPNNNCFFRLQAP